MASLYPGHVGAVQVGAYFLEQYYRILQQQPELVHQFYTDVSSMARFDGTATETATGMVIKEFSIANTGLEIILSLSTLSLLAVLFSLEKAGDIMSEGAKNGEGKVALTSFVPENVCPAKIVQQIHRLVMCLNFKGIEIKSAHSLESWNGGVLVMVSGYVQLKDYSVRRKFVQTFFLAPQEKGFFVLNDIFHLLEEEHVHQHPAAIVGHSNFETNLNVSSSVPETVSDYMLGEQVQAQDLVPPVHVEENDIVEKYGIPEAPQQLPQPDERIDEFPAEDTASYPSGLDTTREPRPATPEEPAGEPTRQTYASILRAKSQSGQSIPHPTSLTKTTHVASEWVHSSQSTAQQPQPAMVPEKSSSEAVEEALPVEDEGEARSVYVGNLPSSISASDLEQVFKNFGRLRSDGVSIRSRKESDVFYAFIEYEDAIGVQNALKIESELDSDSQKMILHKILIASPIQLNGRLIHVEGRRPNSGASRGKRGRGRGGYPSEASRGRFSSRNFGRGSRQDSYDRDYNSRPRGNGYPQRVQERGS
ncbi:Nuclear transport factor 2 (NTF2) domain [Musa troglodytarum]|uniref:Nuclear transport factor 2 (NTF2) domain n=1 Tax=Musa troglodytarum TaxID=320322 RepID=A0A9E7F268_9LILI|nr:Nuclear transport factor 2 (NTF2) domain [Musa troglodytarum]